jgi:GNAT superfamily N-acetyltransferase
LNYVVVGRGANDGGHFGAACTACISRDLPVLATIFPEAGDGVERTAADLGLVYAVDFPFMVRDDAPIEPEGNDSVEVRRAVGPEGADANARVLSSAFRLPQDSTRRALPASLLDTPNLDVFFAFAGDDVVGTVTVIHLGDTSGIWSMATDSTRQRSGIGRRLLSTAMAKTRMQGARRFFLGRPRPAIGSTRARLHDPRRREGLGLGRDPRGLASGRRTNRPGVLAGRQVSGAR